MPPVNRIDISALLRQQTPRCRVPGCRFDSILLAVILKFLWRPWLAAPLAMKNQDLSPSMQGDARTYTSDHSTVYPETFTHQVSDEYSSRWEGPMIYDSIEMYSEALENNGHLHRARTRLTVGYTVRDQHISIYALVLKVL
jgi:hypothetical protein